MTSIAHRILGRTWMWEYVQYRELFFFMVWRDVKIRYKQTLLGVAWAIIQPFMTMIVFSLLFGKVAKLDTEGIPYPIFYYSGLVPWWYFANGVALSGNSLVANSKLIGRVYFPRGIIPASPALGQILDFTIASTIVLALMAYYRIPLSWEMLLWPLLIIPMAVLVIGVGMILSALNVKYRDIKYVIPFFIQSLMFLSPVIYPTSLVPDQYERLMALNPHTGLINAFRAALLPERAIDWTTLGIGCVVILVIFIIGAAYFHKTEREFADVI